MARRKRDGREMIEEDRDVSVLSSFRRSKTRLEVWADGEKEESIEEARDEGKRVSSVRVRDRTQVERHQYLQAQHNTVFQSLLERPSLPFLCCTAASS